MSRGTDDLEESIRAAIREAYKRGGEDTASAIADAYARYVLTDDDLASFADVLAERVPEGWEATLQERRKPGSGSFPGRAFLCFPPCRLRPSESRTAGF